jgi:hypothetical protein
MSLWNLEPCLAYVRGPLNINFIRNSQLIFGTQALQGRRRFLLEDETTLQLSSPGKVAVEGRVKWRVEAGQRQNLGNLKGEL